MDPTTTLTKTSTKSSRSLSTGPIIVKLDGDTGDEIHVDDIPPFPSPTHPCVTTKPLRRKKHLSIYRASAPAQSPVAEVAIEIPCVQRPHSMISPSSEVYDPSSLHPPTKPLSHSRSHSQPNIVRLGHPSRPYYSAIRKNMSRPNSPLGNSSTNPSRPASMALPSHVSGLIQPPPTSFGHLPTAFYDTDDEGTSITPVTSHHRPSSSIFSFGLGGFSSPTSGLHSGSSVSGEMEMRMALAALARESHQQDSSFQFQETGKMHASVSWRVRQLAKGLKDLVRRKHSSH
ncbi:hypothetical protein DFH09DRAFT_399471 [Mycena vulgaris]|nr:hypothetical protein DFH09DRAFT_399471 [Mycena vulgaris]